jgi:hypothetical protein
MMAVIIIFLALIGCVGAFFIGLDLKKWSNWLFSLCGLLIGLLAGLSRNDLYGGLSLGLLLTGLILYIGATNYWHRQRYKDMAASLLLRYEQDERFSLLARILKKLVNK